METPDQVSSSTKQVSENEGIELQIQMSASTVPSQQSDSGSVAKLVERIEYASAEICSKSKSDKDEKISSTDFPHVTAGLKSEAVRDESRVISVEKESLRLLTETSKISEEKEKSDTILIDVSDISKAENVSQVISTEVLIGGESFKTTSNESRLSTLDDKALSGTNTMTSSEHLTHQSCDGDNVLKNTGIENQAFSSGTESMENQNEVPDSVSNVSTNRPTGGDGPVESLKSLCMRDSPINVVLNRLPADIIREVRGSQNVFDSNLASSSALNFASKDRVLLVEHLRSIYKGDKDTQCENLIRDDDSSAKDESKTNRIEESISSSKIQPSERAATADEESVTVKNSADVETTCVKSTGSGGTANVSKTSAEKNAVNEQKSIATEIAGKKAATEYSCSKSVSDKGLADASQTISGENVSKEHSNLAGKIETFHPKQDEKVSNEQVTTAKIAAIDPVSNEAADVGTSETEPQTGTKGNDRERVAFFYISSSSIPGMGKDWEWPSVSNDYHYETPLPQTEHPSKKTQESRNCLGTQRCHYIILAVGVLGAILGCLTYHLQDYGIGPKALKPIGASAAFLSFVVCAFSSVYLTYLSYYTHGRSSQNSDPAASMLIDTVPQCYNSDPRFYFTPEAAAAAQQVFRETQSADSYLDRRGFLLRPAEFKRPFDAPGPSGYCPDSKRIKIDGTISKEELYEMKIMRGTGEKDGCKERNLSQASDSSHYTLADQFYHSSEEREVTEKTPLLPKK